MKKILAILSLVLVTIHIQAQVGVNTETPDESSVLDINSPDGFSKGLLLPKLTTENKNAIVDPKDGLLVFDTDLNSICQYINGSWKNLTLPNRKFFYMPSINIPANKVGDYTVDLYNEYKKQFETPMYASLNAPASIPYLEATDLYYYVAYANSDVITLNSITKEGVLSYHINKKIINSFEFMNIVFVKK